MKRYFSVSSLYELFDTVNAQNILGFIRDVGLNRLSSCNFTFINRFTTAVVLNLL